MTDTYTVDEFQGGRIMLFGGDNRVVLADAPDNSIDSCVTDGPYALVSIVKRFGKEGSANTPTGDGKHARLARGFMGKTWDTGEVVNSVDFWREIYRVLKPGGHLISFGGTRTFHRMACAVEDAGFEIRDMIQWLYGTGFPKSHDVMKGIDAKTKLGSARTEDMRKLAIGNDYEPSGRGRANYDHGGGSAMNGAVGRPETPCAEAQAWEGWGTALKPANEPICLARKPLSEKTIAENVLKWGTGALNIDGCRVAAQGPDDYNHSGNDLEHMRRGAEDWRMPMQQTKPNAAGRWPANVVTDGSEEVVSVFPSSKSTQGKPRGSAKPGDGWGMTKTGAEYTDEGSAARFFYSAKASKHDRAGSSHPTVKPVSLMRYLCRLVTPPGGIVLDPFAGSGTTATAAFLEGFDCYLIEREEEYRADIAARLSTLAANDNEPADSQIDLEEAIANAA